MYVKVLVTPGARKETVEEEKESYFRIAVRERAERNLANDRVRELLARHFGVPSAQVRLLTGHRSRSKLWSIGS